VSPNISVIATPAAIIAWQPQLSEPESSSRKGGCPEACEVGKASVTGINGDAPERVVFNTLRSAAPKWGDLWTRIARDISEVADACTNAMTLGDHHDWVRFAANQLLFGGDTLLQAMCVEWAKKVPQREAARITQVIEDALG